MPPGLSFEDLPAPVRRGVERLAVESSARGIRLFLFGSFARGEARPNSDLDLGYETDGTIPGSTRAWLLDAVAALPTIRPVDLVDFGAVSPAFRAVAESERRNLP